MSADDFFMHFKLSFTHMRLLKRAEIFLASSALIFSFARKEILNNFYKKDLGTFARNENARNLSPWLLEKFREFT